MDNVYKKLFTPLVVGNMVLRNRIIAAPITSYAEEPSPADKWESIAAKARGGASMVVIGSVAINETDALIYHESSSLFGHEKKIFEEEISMIHQYGAKASVELFHGGIFSDCRCTGAIPIGPCTCIRSFKEVGGYERIEPDVIDNTNVIGMDKKMMDRVCQEYAISAKEAINMGFDEIMLHFGHGWLIDQFLSPFFNHRTDEYGGCLENRMRFPKQVVKAVRDAIGPDFPIEVRIGANERIKEGVTLEDITQFLVEIEPLINMVHISSGIDKLVRATSYIESSFLHAHGLNKEYSKYIKQRLKHIPIAVVGGITTPKEAEEILESGCADVIALGRALIADPEWTNKAKAGHPEDIRTCLRCNSCYGVATFGCSQGCAVNPCYERELRLKNEEVLINENGRINVLINNVQPKNKKVLVIGGGPAGMNAAIAAYDKGYQVVLIEKDESLGGLLRISNHDETKIDMYNYKEYLISQINKRKIDVRLNVEATVELAKKENPDRLIVAVGSYPRVLNIPGYNNKNVHDIVSAHGVKLGNNVAIIGGGCSGCEMALQLLRQGHNVTILEKTSHIASTGNLLYRGALEEQFSLYKEKLSILTDVLCKEINENGIIVEKENKAHVLITADDIVYSIGMLPRNKIAQSFINVVYDVRIIGDCVVPRRINEASHEGYFAGRFI